MNNTYLFPTEYFAGNDIYIAFNDIIIDEALTLQFQMQEAIVPIFGYASYTWDTVAKGARTVMGSFRIQFKEAQYLNRKIQEAVNKLNNPTPSSYESGPYIGLSDEELISWMKGQSRSDLQYMSAEYYTRLYGKNPNEYKDRSNQPYFDIPSQGLNLVISYGELPLANNEIRIKQQNQHVSTLGTVKVINNIQITGIQQVIQPTSDAIQEEYTFIARDLDNLIL